MNGKLILPIKITILVISSTVLIYSIITQLNLATITLPLIPISMMILGWIKEGWDIIDIIFGIRHNNNVQKAGNNRFLDGKININNILKI